jgi:DNA-binding CsgD family transcriptional regulator
MSRVAIAQFLATESLSTLLKVTGMGAGVLAAAELPLQWPLVGRHDELDLFEADLSDPRSHGMLIHGAPGVGKTRLADQCLAVARRAGRNVARATASEGSRLIPLGALAHLLPRGLGDERVDLVTVVLSVRPLLDEQMTDGPLVLFVDDLHLLDVTSATLVSQLADAGLIFLLATVRASTDVPAAVDALWQRGRIRRIDLDGLDRTSTDTLLHLVLGAPVEGAAVNELWNAGQGNVMFLRELVLGAIDRGHLVRQRGVWRLIGPLVTTARLQDLITARIGSLPDESIKVLDVLAVWEPIGLAALEQLVGSEQLEELDRLGLLSITRDRRRQRVRLAHPLYGEILRARMPVLKSRRLVLEQVARIEGYGARRREDASRIAAGRLEVLGTADRDLLVRAARLARYAHDFPRVEQFARAAIEQEMSPEVGLLLGEALHEQDSYEEAEKVLSAVEPDAVDDLFVHIIEIRTRNLMWGLRGLEDALTVSRQARGLVPTGPCGQELTLNEAMVLAYAGRPREALALLDSLEPSPPGRSKAIRDLAEVQALAAAGRCATAVELARIAFQEQSSLTEQVAIPAAGTHIVNQLYALTECGRLAEATELATTVYHGLDASAGSDSFIWIAHNLGRNALLRGKPLTARRWLLESLARCEQNRVVGPTRLVLSALGVAHAYVGDVAAASAAALELERLPTFGFHAPEQELGRAWSLVLTGDLPGARSILRAASELAAERGFVGSEAWLLHDILRLGDATGVVDRLAELADLSEGDLVATYAAHAGSLASGRPGELVDVVDRFERIGALLLAAEAANEAAQAFQVAGDRRAAAALGVRSMALSEACEGARTPPLVARVVVVPLTPRERDIAALAARGHASKEIADRLFLSVRTVNNHLQSVYSKLGVSGRHELAAALAEMAEDS